MKNKNNDLSLHNYQTCKNQKVWQWIQMMSSRGGVKEPPINAGGSLNW